MHSYVDRNRLWLWPLFPAVAFAMAPVLSELFGFYFAMPQSVAKGIAVAFVVLCGLGARFTHTMSARVLEAAALIAIVVGLVAALLH